MTKPTAVPTPKEPQREMGIPIKYGKVTNEDFASGLERLKMFTDFKDPRDIWRMAKFIKAFEAAQTRARKWYRKLIDKHAEREPIKRMSKITNKMEDAYDPKTNKPLTRPKQAPDGRGQVSFVFKDEAAFKADIKIFDNHIDVVKVLKFDADDLVKAKLTPAELAACVMMIDNPPEDLADAIAEFDEEISREELDDEDPKGTEPKEDDATGEPPQQEAAATPAN